MGPRIPMIWTSGEFCSGCQSRDWFPRLHVLSPAYIGRAWIQNQQCHCIIAHDKTEALPTEQCRLGFLFDTSVETNFSYPLIHQTGEATVPTLRRFQRLNSSGYFQWRNFINCLWTFNRTEKKQIRSFYWRPTVHLPLEVLWGSKYPYYRKGG